MTVREILIAAKALIPDEDHWWRGHNDSRADVVGCECPITAVRRVNVAGSMISSIALCEAMGFKTLNDLYEWNDAPERTIAEVHAAFDRAIADTAP